MGRHFFLIISLFLSCLFLPNVVSADTAKIDKDTFVCTTGDCSGEPFGNNITMAIQNADSENAYDGNNEAYGIIRFPVSGPVTTATLKIPLWTNGFWGDHGATFNLSLIRTGQDWTESSVTWGTRPTEAGGYSQTVGVPTANVPFAAYNGGASVSNPYIVTFNVTDYVNAVAAGTIQNYGFYLKGIAPSVSGAEYGVVTYAKESNNSNQGYIEYTPDIDPTPTPTPTATPTPTPTPTPGGGGGGSTPTPAPTNTGGSGGDGGTGGDGGSGGGGGGGGGGSSSPTPTPTPIVTIISNTANGFTELSVSVESCTTNVAMTFRTTAETTPTLYYYTNSRVPIPGGGDQMAVGYQDNSTQMAGSAGTEHSFALTGLSASTTYYFTLVLADGTQDYEHSFTTSAGPAACPIPSPTDGNGGNGGGTGGDGDGVSGIIDDLFSGDTPGEAILAGFFALGTLGGPLAAGLGGLGGPGGIGLNTWWFNVLSKRKRIKPWGRVVSTLTEVGIPEVSVSLIDAAHYNRVIERTISQEDGTFGFTAPAGKYSLWAERSGFIFPSKHADKGYTGGELKIDESGIMETDIPMDATQESRRFKDSLTHFLLQLEVFRLPLLIFGTMVTIAFLIYQITVLSLLFLFYYLLLWFWEFKRNNESRHLLYVTDPHNKPVPFASVRVKTSSEKTILTRSTNDKGAVFILVKQGSYDVEITPPVNSGLKPQRHPVELERGLLMKDLRVKLRAE